MSILKRTGNRVDDALDKPRETGIAAFRRQIDREIDRAFGRIWRSFDGGAADEIEPMWPALDIVEDDKAITLKLDVPGLGPKDIEVEVSNGVLTVHGARSEETRQGNGGRYRSERYVGSFARSAALPEYADADKVEAKYDKGVLTLTVPKIPGKAPVTRKVPVKSE